MRDAIATAVLFLVLMTGAFLTGFACAPPPEVVIERVEVPGPEREVEIEKLVYDPKDAVEIARLTEELATANADKAKYLAGWRKTYELWKKLYDSRTKGQE